MGSTKLHITLYFVNVYGCITSQYIMGYTCTCISSSLSAPKCPKHGTEGRGAEVKGYHSLWVSSLQIWVFVTESATSCQTLGSMNDIPT